MAQPNKELWKKAYNAAFGLNSIINNYIRRYINTYETLSESFMNMYSGQRLRRLRVGTEQQMRSDVEDLYKRIQQNAMAFNTLFGHIGQLVAQVIGQLQPTENHEEVLQNSIQQANVLRGQVVKVTVDVAKLCNEVIEREELYGMMAIYRRRRTYPLEVPNWFPYSEGQIIFSNWYRHAHHRLLSLFNTVMVQTFNKSHHVNQIVNRINEFVLQHLTRLNAAIPNFGIYTTGLQTLTLYIAQATQQCIEIRANYNKNGREQVWRHSLITLVNEVQPYFDQIKRDLSEFLNKFEEWKNEYLASNATDMDDVIQEFEQIFKKK